MWVASLCWLSPSCWYTTISKTETMKLSAKKYLCLPWPMWLSWLEHHPLNQRAMDSIPSHGSYPVCGLDPWSGWVGEGNQLVFLFHIYVSLLLSPSFCPPLSLPLPLKAMNKCPWVKIKKKVPLLKALYSFPHLLSC